MKAGREGTIGPKEGWKGRVGGDEGEEKTEGIKKERRRREQSEVDEDFAVFLFVRFARLLVKSGFYWTNRLFC